MSAGGLHQRPVFETQQSTDQLDVLPEAILVDQLQDRFDLLAFDGTAEAVQEAASNLGRVDGLVVRVESQELVVRQSSAPSNAIVRDGVIQGRAGPANLERKIVCRRSPEGDPEARTWLSALAGRMALSSDVLTNCLTIPLYGRQRTKWWRGTSPRGSRGRSRQARAEKSLCRESLGDRVAVLASAGARTETQAKGSRKLSASQAASSTGPSAWKAAPLGVCRTPPSSPAGRIGIARLFLEAGAKPCMGYVSAPEPYSAVSLARTGTGPSSSSHALPAWLRRTMKSSCSLPRLSDLPLESSSPPFCRCTHSGALRSEPFEVDSLAFGRTRLCVQTPGAEALVEMMRQRIWAGGAGHRR
jgi:hypothetical protein